MGIMRVKKIILLLFLLVNGFVFSQTNTETETVTINGKQYYLYTIEKGNTLYSISKQFNTPLDIIMQENPQLQNNPINKGDKIKIPVKYSEENINYQNGNFINHKVKQGETVYAIAREYNISANDILANNPEVGNELKPDQILKIPVSKIKKQPTEIIPNKNQKSHLVIKGETLYSLSKLYNVAADSILKANDGLPNGLKEGETIVIPTAYNRTQSVQMGTATLKSELINSELKSTYNVAVILPFFIYQNTELEQAQSGKPLDEQYVFPRSKIAFEFYQGVLLALDSIEKKIGKEKFKLHIYDSGRDTNNIADLLIKPEMKKMDLIIGPFYYSAFVKTAEFAKQYQIPIVSPVAINNKVLLGNPYVIKTQPSKTIQTTRFAEYVADSFRYDNVIIIQPADQESSSTATLFNTAYKNYLAQKHDSNTVSFPKVISWGTGGIATLNSSLSKEKRNFIFVPTASQIFATELVNSLSGLHESYMVSIGGMENWLKYENIDIAYFNRFNLHVIKGGFVDNENRATQNFQKEYVKKFSTYPGNYAISGFETILYFLENLNKNGKSFFQQNMEPSYNNIYVNFRFLKTGPESGFENTACTILYYKEFLLKKADR
jgi:LysM repeat protein